MTLSKTFQSKSAVRLYVGTETTFGTAAVAGGTWNEYPVKEIGSLPQFSMAAESIARRSGSSLEPSGGVNQNPCAGEYEVEVTFYATINALVAMCGWTFEDVDSAYILAGNYTKPTTWFDATAVGAALPVTLLFKDAGHVTDLKYTSCVCKRMEIMGDVTADGGLLLVKGTFYTAYAPVEADLDPSSQPTWDSSTIRKMCELVSGTTTVDSLDILISSFSIVLEREVGRLPIKNAATYIPFGYTMGNWTVTGTIHSPKADANTLSLAEEFYDNTTVPIVLTMAASSSGAISLPTVKLDSSQITDDDQLRGLDIPFRAVFDESDITSTAFSLTMTD